MVQEILFKYCGHMFGTPEWQMKSHVHRESHEIIVVQKGVMVAKIRGREYRAGAGQVLFYPRGVFHDEQAGENLSLETFFAGVVTRGSGKICDNPGPVFDRHGRMRALAHWMHELSHSGGKPDEALLDRLAYAFLREWDSLNRPAEPEFMRVVKTYIEKNLTRPVELPDLARAAGLSVSRFAHLFREKAGVPPMDYLRRRRVEYARLLLLTTPMPIKAIAEECGYADQYVFNKTFKRMTGTPPGAVRRCRSR